MVMAEGKKSNKMKLVVMTAVLFFMLLAGVGVWLIVVRNQTAGPFTKKFTQSVTFPLYYPSELPTNYALDKSSVDGNNTTAHYNLVNSTKKLTITVTLQKTPPGFDAAKIIGSNPIPTSIMPSGTLYNLSIGGNSKYMFTTNSGTLLFITSSKAVPSEDINAITNQLTIAK